MADEALFFNLLKQACWFLRCRIEYLGQVERATGREEEKKLVGGQRKEKYGVRVRALRVEQSKSTRYPVRFWVPRYLHVKGSCLY